MPGVRMKDNPRRHGAPPFRVVVVHGGPGAGGEMAPVARELASRRGVLEPIQTAPSLDGQVAELRGAIETHAAAPVVLVGYSWGAWLACLVACEDPAVVERLVLVSSGPFEEKYVSRFLEARMARLDPDEREEYWAVLARLDDPAARDRDSALERLGALCAKADAFDPIPWETRDADVVPCDAAVFDRLWREGAEIRRSGALLAAAAKVKCPVIAIHGAHDPHPSDGVKVSLSKVLKDFHFVLLEKCGHTPWLERHARSAFFDALEAAIEGQPK